MKIRSRILGRWVDVVSRLPSDFDLEATARSRGAFVRAREVDSAQTLLRLALAYGGCGMSLRETCAWAEAAGIARLANPSLLARLGNAADWLGDLVGALIGARAKAPEGPADGRWAGRRLRALDATTICEPGAKGASWRLHVGYDLAGGQVDQVTLTDVHGGENLQRLRYAPGDIVLADRGYARPRDLRPVIEDGADLIVRTGWNSLRLLKPDRSAFDLFAALAKLKEQEGEVSVQVDERQRGPAPDPLILRLIVRRKSPEQAGAEQRRLLKEAKKRGRSVDPRSLEAANYILLLTSLPADAFTAADALALYRFRWQIELAFKRMKSLGGLDALAAKTPRLAKTSIYAKLIAYLIAERNAGQVPDSSPCAPESRDDKPVPMAHRETGPRRRAQRHSGLPALAAPSTRLCANAATPA